MSAENCRIMVYLCVRNAKIAEHAKFGEKTDNTECHSLGEKIAIFRTDKMESGKKENRIRLEKCHICRIW